MIVFNELRITPDSKYLIVDVSVEDSPCFNDITIENIIIDNQDTYIQNGPSSNPIVNISTDSVFKEVFNPEGECYSNVYTNESKCYLKDKKAVRLYLDLSEYSINPSDMLFVYVITNGETSCEISSCIMNTVVNLYPIYKETIKYIREIESSCDLPKSFIDKFLKLKALDLCIRTGNYTQAIKYWNKFFKKSM